MFVPQILEEIRLNFSVELGTKTVPSHKKRELDWWGHVSFLKTSGCD